MLKIIQSFVLGTYFFSLILIPIPSTAAQKCNMAVPSTTSHLQDNKNGTISDAKTSLMWKKCTEGQNWNTKNNTCDNSYRAFIWQMSLQRAIDVNNGLAGENLGKRDWRVPNIKELTSITERQCWNPSINLSIFPVTTRYSSSTYYAWVFWSSSPSLLVGDNIYRSYAWQNNGPRSKNEYASVRLVRNDLLSVD